MGNKKVNTILEFRIWKSEEIVTNLNNTKLNRLTIILLYYQTKVT